MSPFLFAWRMLRRDLRAGELHLLGVALFVAVASLSSVGFLTQRIEQGINRDATQLLGGDLLISGDRPAPAEWVAQARADGLRAVQVLQFNSMASTDEAAQLAAIKVVEPGYPLRGSLQIAAAPGEPAREAGAVPAPGEAWLDEQLLAALGLNPGDVLQLGYLDLRVTALVTYESDRGMGFSSFVPRLMINAADLPASGLIQEGSRVRHRLQLAGEREAVQRFHDWVKPRLQRGQELESIDNARPEIRERLDRGARFLRLAAMLAVVLAAVAIGLASRRYLQRHLDGCAVMRCFGAGRAQLLSAFLLEFLIFGLAVAALACLAGFGLQLALAELARALVKTSLPPVGITPVLQGLLVGMLLVLGFVAPQLLQLTRVPPIRVIRRDLGVPQLASLLAWGGGAAALGGMMLWIAADLRLGLAIVGGFAAALTVFAAAAWGMLGAFGRLRHIGGGWGLRYGLAALSRRRASSVLQVVALALGLTAILLLTLVSQDLLSGWRNKLPPDAPNRFMIGVQPEQREPLAQFFAAQGVPMPELSPMIRGRLVAINDRPVRGEDYQEERARNLAEREFNLSYGGVLQSGNEVVAGRWHGEARVAEFSMEEGIGERLGVKLGDEVNFEIAGQRVSGRVSSVRKLDWDSMRVNFFFTGAPGLLDGMPASFITSFYLPPERADLVRALVAAFPNVTVIDVGAVLAQVANLTERLASVVQFVFAFALFAGLTVLLAAQQGTHDERRFEISVLRALGARQQQVRAALAAEFLALGALASLLAVLAAWLIGQLLASQVLQLSFTPDWLDFALAAVLATAVIAISGWLGVRGVLQHTVMDGIRAAS